MKKKFIHYIICLGLLTSSSSCSNLLDLTPEGSLTEQSTFTNYNNFISYAWQFYNTFAGYTNVALDSEVDGDLFAKAQANSTSDWIWQRKVVPSTSDDYNRPFVHIRAINVLLDAIDQASQLSDSEKKHIRSIGYFFKAY